MNIAEPSRMGGVLPEGEPSYRDIFNATSDGLLIHDEEGTILFVNHQACAMFGFSHAEFLHLSVSDLSLSEAPYTQAEGLRHLQHAFERGSCTFPWRSRRKNGELFWSEVALRSCKIGGKKRVIGSVRDITERRRLEESLRQEELLFRSLASTIPDHIYFKDRQSRFVRINDSMARRFLLTDPTQAVGKTDADFFSAEHAQQAYNDEQVLMSSGEPLLGLEEKETWPDGRVTWVSTTKVPLRTHEGAICGLVGVSRDITERTDQSFI